MITLSNNTELGNRISEIMDRCGSDKQKDHNYSEGYSYLIDKVLGISPNAMLEIGIANQVPEESSLHGWAEVFPHADIYGIDIAPRKMIETDRIKTFIADQSEPFDLSKFKSAIGRRKLDIILDDGSHVFRHALVSFEVLFSMLSPHGLYMIEDVSKANESWEQTVSEWEKYLSLRNDINYEIIDCKPENTQDDSVLIGIWRK